MKYFQFISYISKYSLKIKFIYSILFWIILHIYLIIIFKIILKKQLKYIF